MDMTWHTLTTPVRRTRFTRIRDAESVLGTLRGALRSGGVTLLPFGLDTRKWSDGSEHALIELDQCSRDTTRRLASTLHATSCAESS